MSSPAETPTLLARSHSSRRTAVRYGCYGLSILLFATYGWLRSVFGNRLTVEQIFFHFDLGLNSLTGIDLYLILDAIRWVILPTVAITAALYVTGLLIRPIATSMTSHRLLPLRGLRLASQLAGQFYLGLTSLGLSLFLALFTTVLFLYTVSLSD
ncbi:MAG: hypothetical protein EBV64_11305 [Oxalobacteraceae bacterium]|nr:hypothetical protein [Oxalobacteraceae bacterium]